MVGLWLFDCWMTRVTMRGEGEERAEREDVSDERQGGAGQGHQKDDRQCQQMSSVDVAASRE